jgi:hypothetical protein
MCGEIFRYVVPVFSKVITPSGEEDPLPFFRLVVLFPSLAIDQERMGTAQFRFLVERTNLSTTSCASHCKIECKNNKNLQIKNIYSYSRTTEN